MAVDLQRCLKVVHLWF